MKFTTSGVLTLVQRCLVVAIPSDWDDELMCEIRRECLVRISDSDLDTLVFDFKAVDCVDTAFINSVCDTAKMARMLGREVVAAEVGPGVAASLVGLNLNLDGFKCVSGIDEVLAIRGGNLAN